MSIAAILVLFIIITPRQINTTFSAMPVASIGDIPLAAQGINKGLYIYISGAIQLG
jgi:hypothetical protein